MARPAKYKTKDGRPIRRIGERRLKAIDDNGQMHDMATVEEAVGIIQGSRDLLLQLTNAGVIRVIGSSSESGTRLYSRRDLEAVHSQLFDGGPPAVEAVGLQPKAEPK